MNRRKFLRVASGTTALNAFTGLATADTGQQIHELCIYAPDDKEYPYAFSVSGDITAAETPRDADINPEFTATDPEDMTHGCTATGWLSNDYDCYRFDGNIETFDIVEAYADRYIVWLDGSTKTSPADYITDSHPLEAESCAHHDGSRSTEHTTQPDETVCRCPADFLYKFPCRTDCERSDRRRNVLKLKSPNPECAWFRFKPEGACSTPGGNPAGGVWGTITSFSGRSMLTGISFSGDVAYLELSSGDIEYEINWDDDCECGKG